MINLDKRFRIMASIFMVLAVFYLCSDVIDSVMWTIYAFGLKDFFIIALSSLFIGINKKTDLMAIGLICYLSVPTILRISCAINSNFNYLAYRNLITNSEYSYLLLFFLLFTAIILYYAFRNERKN